MEDVERKKHGRNSHGFQRQASSVGAFGSSLFSTTRLQRPEAMALAMMYPGLRREDGDRRERQQSWKASAIFCLLQSNVFAIDSG
jgi:hypothetical protein